MKNLFICTLVLFSILFVACNSSNGSVNVQSIKISEIGKLKIDHKDLVILDVRTPKEISNGKIDNDALELDFYSDNFEEELNKMDKSKTYLVYCKSGGRSSQAIQSMSKSGFTNLFNLEGGFQAWARNN